MAPRCCRTKASSSPDWRDKNSHPAARLHVPDGAPAVISTRRRGRRFILTEPDTAQQHQRGTEHDHSDDPSGRGLRVLYDIKECHAKSHEYESQHNIASASAFRRK